MQDPYAILGLGQDADEAAIRRRYLELVRQFQPEREPQRAAEIRAAYDLLRDPIARLENQLFSIRLTQTFDRLLAEYKPDIRDRRLSTELLLSLGQS